MTIDFQVTITPPTMATLGRFKIMTGDRIVEEGYFGDQNNKLPTLQHILSKASTIIAEDLKRLTNG